MASSTAKGKQKVCDSYAQQDGQKVCTTDYKDAVFYQGSFHHQNSQNAQEPILRPTTSPWKPQSPETAMSWDEFSFPPTPQNSESSSSTLTSTASGSLSPPDRETHQDRGAIPPVPLHIVEAKRDINAQQHLYSQISADWTHRQALLSEERDLERGPEDLASGELMVVESDAEDRARMEIGTRIAKSLYYRWPIVLGTTMALLFVLQAIVHFVFGWTLEGDCIGCQYS